MISGLYVITDPDLIAEEVLTEAVAAAIRGGARCVQYRAKGIPAPDRRRQAAALAALCRGHDTLFIVNDDTELACEVEADGVHIGRDDPDIDQARRRVGKRLIGVSCYNELPRARAAAAAGADYVAFGSFFASRLKPEAVRAEPALLRTARAELAIPIVAIGGINAENGATLIEAGADALAVITAVLGQPDIEAAARRFAGLFHETRDRNTRHDNTI